ncbi:hypothetical protein NARC_60047 [Candidatus Nitrosocosmicus arcticus]|uniref:Uncharacterized protein n=1 Tax=Candidatus Nitrosocosmicus arcticus TaxID=2035267 RepID=A0A557SVM7_9ARCH|nr:hypothetical protein NARC_60047 [Candidatus Nitrosocosmicus arcticus]
MEDNQEFVFSYASSIQYGKRFTLIVNGSKSIGNTYIQKKFEALSFQHILKWFVMVSLIQER